MPRPRTPLTWPWLIVVCIASPAVASGAQEQPTAPPPSSQPDEPKFEVASVKKSGPMQPTLPGTPNRMQLLVRSLLKDRFALVFHNETRELPLSYLVLAREDGRLGERLRPSTVDCRALFAARAKEGAAPMPPPKPGEPPAVRHDAGSAVSWLARCRCPVWRRC